ncbi:hypothetical protein N2V92_02050 [Bacillus sp. CH_48]|uniref:hypothetical protein n=1 Tax=Bacillus TaxID=1386 RepID=UPI0014789670|nr:hypothetical protein [Bacillus thuringiensis]MCU5539047.1 hypothetical protein [Bacillus cereus]NNG93860.1 hypothetical protein [Bacillus thuringiensis]HDR6956460.1 hypothetical protein [Bacillus cereus]HDR7692518.1 hypothetical protein [Bacillus thuringiensis]
MINFSKWFFDYKKTSLFFFRNKGNENLSVWKYMGITKFKFLLVEKAILFAILDVFVILLEGRYLSEDVEYGKKIAQQILVLYTLD